MNNTIAHTIGFNLFDSDLNIVHGIANLHLYLQKQIIDNDSVKGFDIDEIIDNYITTG